MEALNTQLSNALQDNEDQLQQMAEEVSKLQQTLAQRAVPTATPPLHSRATQTADDPYAKVCWNFNYKIDPLPDHSIIATFNSKVKDNPFTRSSK